MDYPLYKDYNRYRKNNTIWYYSIFYRKGRSDL